MRIGKLRDVKPRLRTARLNERINGAVGWGRPVSVDRVEAMIGGRGANERAEKTDVDIEIRCFAAENSIYRARLEGTMVPLLTVIKKVEKVKLVEEEK